jgi:hypothetical protein
MKKAIFLLLITSSQYLSGQKISKAFDLIFEKNYIGAYSLLSKYQNNQEESYNVIVPYAFALIYKETVPSFVHDPTKHSNDNLKSALLYIEEAQKNYSSSKTLGKLGISRQTLDKLFLDLQNTVYNNTCNFFEKQKNGSKSNLLSDNVTYFEKDQYPNVKGIEALSEYSKALYYLKNSYSMPRLLDEAQVHMEKVINSYHKNDYPNDFCIKEADIEATYNKINQSLITRQYNDITKNPTIDRESVRQFVLKNPKASENIKLLDQLFNQNNSWQDFKWYVDNLPENPKTEDAYYMYLKLNGRPDDYKSFMLKYPDSKYKSLIEPILNRKFNAYIEAYYSYQFGEKIPDNQYFFLISSNDQKYTVTLNYTKQEDNDNQYYNDKINYTYYIHSDKMFDSLSIEKKPIKEAEQDFNDIKSKVQHLFTVLSEKIGYPFNNKIEEYTPAQIVFIQQSGSKKIERYFNSEIRLIKEVETDYDDRNRPQYEKTIYSSDRITEDKYKYNGVNSADVFSYDNGELIMKSKFVVDEQGHITEQYSYNKYNGSLSKMFEFKYDEKGRIIEERRFNEKTILKFEKEYIDDNQFYYNTKVFQSNDNGKTFNELKINDAYTIKTEKKDNRTIKTFFDKNNVPVFCIENYFFKEL